MIIVCEALIIVDMSSESNDVKQLTEELRQTLSKSFRHKETMSEMHVFAIVKIQALFRGHLARKRKVTLHRRRRKPTRTSSKSAGVPPSNHIALDVQYRQGAETERFYMLLQRARA